MTGKDFDVGRIDHAAASKASSLSSISAKSSMKPSKSFDEDCVSGVAVQSGIDGGKIGQCQLGAPLGYDPCDTIRVDHAFFKPRRAAAFAAREASHFVMSRGSGVDG